MLQGVYTTTLGLNWNESLLWCSGKHSCLVFILKTGLKLRVGVMGHIRPVLLSVSSLQRLRTTNMLPASLFLMCLEHLWPLSVIIMCEYESHLSARIPNLRRHVLVSWISVIVSRFKSLTGNRRTWMEKPGVVGHRSLQSGVIWGGERGSGWHAVIRPLTPGSARGEVLSSVTNGVKHAPGSRTEQ